MYLIVIHLSIIEIAVLFAGAIVLGLAIHFFIINRRSLQEAIEETKQKTIRPGYTPPSTSKPSRQIDAPVPAPLKESRRANVIAEHERVVAIKPKTIAREESVENLKETVLQQQKLLSSFLKQVEEIEKDGKEELEMQNKHLHTEIKSLEEQLLKKDTELQEAKQKASISDRMATKIDEVYEELELLQEKMSSLEKQANRANNLALELEDVREAYEQIHKDLQRKTQKLDETFAENQRLQQEFNTIEDKLAEANVQRQQLQKKVQFLQELNTDLQSVSDTNKKLQTELRRIGELESMLDMIAEERDYLLRKQGNK